MKENINSYANKPNILFIISDDHRFDGIGAYGNPVIQTPVLDRIAQKGVLFQSTYTMGAQMGAVCVPSRACLHTGVNVLNATVCEEINLRDTEDQSQWNINPDLPILPEIMRNQGYHTHGIGKWHNGRASFHRGFSDGSNIFFGGMDNHTGMPLNSYDSEGNYPEESAYPGKGFSSELFADAAIDFIRDYDQEEPFFLYVSFTAPHDPRTPPDEYAAMYVRDEIPLPENFMTEHPFDNGELGVRDERLAPTPRTPNDIRQHIADYYAMISHLDTQIGRVIQQLEDSGQLDHTIIVYTADHGLSVGQHGLMGKQNLYEHSIHIPLIMCGPGIPTGQEVKALSCQVDILPTVCQLTGVPIPSTVEGQSLHTLISGEKETVRDSVFSLYKDIQRTVRDDRWKLIRYYRWEEYQSGTNRIQLFDLLTDPLETRDLSEETDQQERIQQLKKIMVQWQEKIGDPLVTIE